MGQVPLAVLAHKGHSLRVAWHGARPAAAPSGRVMCSEQKGAVTKGARPGAGAALFRRGRR